MKKLAIILILVISAYTRTGLIAQDSIQNNDPVIYSVAVNIVPDGFNFPLLGFVNIAKGNHSSAHLGFVNFNYKGFRGAQLGYINTVGKETVGLQAGFINTSASYLKGVQYGFINTVGNSTTGGQIGFINTTAKNIDGGQLGFVNIAADSVQGAQIGFVNMAKSRIEGAQLGFVNASKKLKGIQIGFLNLTDSIECGVPLGFLSIVKHGGYQAVEVSVNEIYPFNVSFKIGVSKFYTSFNASYNPEWNQGFATGVGIGSVLAIGEKLFFNPELVTMNTIGNDFQKTTSLSAGFGYNITPHFQITAGPSVSWHHKTNNDEVNEPFLPIFIHNANAKNDLIIGFRFGVRYSFTSL